LRTILSGIQEPEPVIVERCIYKIQKASGTRFRGFDVAVHAGLFRLPTVAPDVLERANLRLFGNVYGLPA